MQTSYVEAKRIQQCGPETKSSKKQILMQWIADKKTGLYDRFNRMYLHVIVHQNDLYFFHRQKHIENSHHLFGKQ